MTDFIGLGHAMWPKSHFDAIRAEPTAEVEPLDDGKSLVFFDLGSGHRGRMIVDIFADADIVAFRKRRSIR